MRTALVLMSISLVVCAASQACGTSEEDPLPCVAANVDCQPIVSPTTFDALYTNVFQTSCASGTGRCHGAAVAGGLDMRTADSAFEGLSKRVDTNNPGCSLVLRRVEASSASNRMPPGPTPLSEPQRCAIRHWIRDGAQR